MKILFISTSPLEYSASSNMRNVALLKGLIENGHSISTLTPEPQKDAALYDPHICNINFDKRYYLQIGKIHSIATQKNENNNRIKSQIKKIIRNTLKKYKIYDFRSSLAKQKIIIDEKYDFIISSSDPKSSHLLAKKLIENNPNITKEWIQYWGDPFADDINDNRKFFKLFIKKEEEKLIKSCDKIIYVSPFTLKKQQLLYPKYKDKMFFLPIPYNKEIIYKSNISKNIEIGYFGDYYSRNRNIIPLYNAIKNNSKIKLNICGNSDISLENTKNIKINSRQSIKKIREYEEKSDILVCVCNTSGTQIPGKIYHYAATNKPILIILDGENKEELKKYFLSFKRYILTDNNENEINSVINSIINDQKEYFPCKKLNAKNIAKEFIE